MKLLQRSAEEGPPGLQREPQNRGAGRLGHLWVTDIVVQVFHLCDSGAAPAERCSQVEDPGKKSSTRNCVGNFPQVQHR